MNGARTSPSVDPAAVDTAVVDAVHAELLAMSDVDRSRIAGAVARRLPLASPAEIQATVAAVGHRRQGLGPLEPLLARAEVTDIMVNGPGAVWVEAHGELEETDVVLDASLLWHLVERIVGPLGRRIDRSSPLVDARLPDGSRVHVVGPPLAVDGPYVTIRRFRAAGLDLEDFAPPGTCALLRWAVRSRSNIVVSGGTSTGKTTLLNALAAEIGRVERLVTVEDAAELDLQARHVVRLEARPRQVDGPEPVTIRELVRSALRMRPDRIIVGEVRGGEALDMLQAMNTGHEGSLGTCHANSALDALRRLETMVLSESGRLPLSAVRERIVAAVDLVVHLERAAGGRRVVAEVAEPVSGDPLTTIALAHPEGLLRLPGRPPRRGGAPPCASWLPAGSS